MYLGHLAIDAAILHQILYPIAKCLLALGIVDRQWESTVLHAVVLRGNFQQEISVSPHQ